MPLLHADSGRSRPALFAAAGELAYLVAYMANDVGRVGLSQRYYVRAARLGDVTLRSYAFRSLAVQAVDLGHATGGGRDTGTAALQPEQRTRAVLRTVRASGSAAVGNSFFAAGQCGRVVSGGGGASIRHP